MVSTQLPDSMPTMKPPLVIFGHTRIPLALANTSWAPFVSAWNFASVAFASASSLAASWAVRAAAV